MEDKETIDLALLKNIVLTHKKKLAGIIIGCTLLAVIVSFALPKEYESTTLLRSKGQRQSGFSLQAASAMAMLGSSGGTSTQAYIEILKSRSVLEPVIAELDMPEEKKEKLTVQDFAKSNLKIANTKGTDLIEVTAKGKSPEEAQKISADVVSSFQLLLTKLSKSEQSFMLKFLTERIQVAKQEVEQAEQNLEQFRQQSKLFLPDAQAKAAVEKLTVIDKKLSEQKVLNQGNAAKIAGSDEQLALQNASMRSYQVSDDAVITDIRKKIVTKQLELIELQQRFTEKHPDVIAANNEIDSLTQRLREEVNRTVSAGTTTMNPLHSALLVKKATAETELQVGNSAAEALRAAQSQMEESLGKMSEQSLTYIGLERKVKVSQEVYATLLKNYEQTRVQEAMESMDVQIVDSAELPKKPSGPNKRLITAIGFLLGILGAGAYTLRRYISAR